MLLRLDRRLNACSRSQLEAASASSYPSLCFRRVRTTSRSIAPPIPSISWHSSSPSCFRRPRSPSSGHPSHVQDKIGEAFAKFDVIALDAKHERLTHFTAEPDQSSLVRTMLRLRHDLIMIGRAGLARLPKRSRSGSGHRSRTSASLLPITCTKVPSALLARRGPPAIDAFVGSLDSYVAEMAALRHEGLT